MTRPLAFKIPTERTGETVTVRLRGQLDARSPQHGYDVAVVRGPRAVERLFAVMQLHRKLRTVDDPA